MTAQAEEPACEINGREIGIALKLSDCNSANRLHSSAFPVAIRYQEETRENWKQRLSPALADD